MHVSSQESCHGQLQLIALFVLSSDVVPSYLRDAGYCSALVADIDNPSRLLELSLLRPTHCSSGLAAWLFPPKQAKLAKLLVCSAGYGGTVLVLQGLRLLYVISINPNHNGQPCPCPLPSKSAVLSSVPEGHCFTRQSSTSLALPAAASRKEESCQSAIYD